MKCERIILWSLLLSLGTFISFSHAQLAPSVTPASIEAVQVIGLTGGVKQNTKDKKVENRIIHFRFLQDHL